MNLRNPRFWIACTAATVTITLRGDLFADSLLRGPYLQSCSSTGIVVCWRSDVVSEARVRCYDTNTSPPLELEFSDGAVTDEHKVQLTGLVPDRTYLYSVEAPSGTLASGSQFRFHTHPTNARPVRIWAIGDAGSGNTNQIAVREACLNFSNRASIDVWLMLGDNVYPDGSDRDYQLYMFDMYTDLFRRTPFWPAMGNHDAAYGWPATFLNIFALPRNGEAGGVPSQSGLYCSFDYANIHFVCLDSWISDHSAQSEMLNWLRADLAATTQDWIIAYWHHPPYSMGTDFSDSTPILVEMRENVVPILESYGVDLVLAGHSHVYERSFLLNGHYGPSWTFSPTNAIDSGLGREDQGGAYRKVPGRAGANQGTVYLVCGNSGQGGPVNFVRHPAMAITANGYGSVVIDVNGSRLDAKYLHSNGNVRDYFTIDKSASDAPPRMSIGRMNHAAAISWPVSSREFAIEWSPTAVGTNWRRIPDVQRLSNRSNFVNIGATNAASFFRLRPLPQGPTGP